MLLHTYHILEYMTWQELVLKIYIKKESLLHISFFSSQSPIWSAMHIALDVDVSYYYLYFCTKLFIWKCSTRHALTNSASTLPFEKVSLTAPRKDVISQWCLLLKTLKQVFSTTKKKRHQSHPSVFEALQVASISSSRSWIFFCSQVPDSAKSKLAASVESNGLGGPPSRCWR